MTMNGTWGFDFNDHSWKSKEDLIRKLVDIASKGGNFLLNVGPTGGGEIPAPSVERLEAVGAWMKVNSRSIYGTHANPFPESPSWGRVTRAKNEDGSDRLYLQVFDWPSNGKLELSGLLSTPKSVQILGQRTRTLLTFTQHDDLTVFNVPNTALDPVCTVLAVDLAEPLAIALAPTISASDEKFFGTMAVTVAQPTATKVVYRFTSDGSQPTATSTAAGAAINLSKSATINARGFLGTKPVTRTVTQTFELMTPLKCVNTLKSEPGLSSRSYTGDFKVVADISSGTLVNQGVVAVPDQSIKPREEYFGLVFTGFIDVPTTGLYRFYSDSDDGSTLSLHGKIVVDNDGMHNATERSGAIALEAGLHPIEIRMIEGMGQDLLRVSWLVPGSSKKELITAKAFVH